MDFLFIYGYLFFIFMYEYFQFNCIIILILYNSILYIVFYIFEVKCFKTKYHVSSFAVMIKLYKNYL